MRWMEALLERSNGSIGRTTTPWSDDGEDSPDRAAVEQAVGLGWPTRTLNLLLALLALVAFAELAPQSDVP